MLIDIKIREDILINFPNFNYLNSPNQELVDFTKENNLVGQQQEAFIFYWILKTMQENGDNCTAGIDIGCGQSPHFFTIGVNDYSGTHPVYGGEYRPHIVLKAEDINQVFRSDVVSFIVASHILEHVDNPIVTFRNWCKLLKKDGIIILLMPDYDFEKSVVSWDPTHKTFWNPSDFEKNCIIPNQDIIKCEEFNSLKNKFSFNAILRRI